MPFSDRIAQDISELIGATPMVKLNRLVEQDAAQILEVSEAFLGIILKKFDRPNLKKG